jgi:dTDP-glucose 4,6-dehydratase
LIEGKKIPVYGSGINIRDWLHVDDHCSAIYKAITKGKAGEIYNIGGGLELTNLELAKQILSAMNKSESEIEYVQDRKGHDLRYSVNCSKANKEIEYYPKVKFTDGLLETIKWYVENEEWWKPLKTI